MKVIFSFVLVVLLVGLVACSNEISGELEGVPQWVPLPAFEEGHLLVNEEGVQTKYIITLKPRASVQSVHSFYHTSLQEWERHQWSYQPAQQSLDLTVSKLNRKVMVSGKIIPESCAQNERKYCTIRIIAWE
jgi:hypothetical protein